MDFSFLGQIGLPFLATLASVGTVILSIKANRRLENYKVQLQTISERIARIGVWELETHVEIWELIEKAYDHVLSAAKNRGYPELDHMTDEEYEEFLDSSSLKESEKQAADDVDYEYWNPFYSYFVRCHHNTDAQEMAEKAQRLIASRRPFLRQDLVEALDDFFSLFEQANEVVHLQLGRIPGKQKDIDGETQAILEALDIKLNDIEELIRSYIYAGTDDFTSISHR